MFEGEAICDLEYIEDSAAETDMNVVMTEDGRIIEAGHRRPNPSPMRSLLLAMLARQGRHCRHYRAAEAVTFRYQDPLMFSSCCSVSDAICRQKSPANNAWHPCHATRTGLFLCIRRYSMPV